MSDVDFNRYLLFVIAIAIGIGILNITRVKKRGNRAWFLALGSFALALGAELYRLGASTGILACVGVIIFASLVGDIFMKNTANNQSREGRE